jgi:DNA-binding protein H-NS
METVEMSTYQALQVQIANLQEQAEQARKKELASVINEIKHKIALYNLASEDLGFPVVRRIKNGKKAPLPPKYRDPRTDQTWSGRGKPPKWIAGKNREKFLIQ